MIRRLYSENFRMSPMKSASVLAIAVALTTVTSLSADILQMGNGTRMEGRILEEAGDSIRFETLQRIELNIPVASVSSIERREASQFHERLAEMARSTGRYEDAVAHLERAIAVGGDSTLLQARIDDIRGESIPQASAQFASRITSAREALEAGRLEDAERRLRGLLGEIPGDDDGSRLEANRLLSRTLSSQAERLVDSVNYAQAERVLREALVLTPSDHLVMAQLAGVLGRNPLKREEAVGLYRQAIGAGGEGISSADRNQIMFAMGSLYRDMNDHGNAVRFLRAVHQSDPRFASDLQRVLIDSLVAFGRSCEPDRRELAVRSATEALAINDRTADARLLLANNLLQMRKYTEAVEALKPLAEREPRRRGVNQQLAMAYLRQGQFAEARACFQKELALNSQNYDALCELAELDLAAGLLREAREKLDRARAIDERNPRAILVMSRVEREAENYTQAHSHVRRVLDANPEHLAGNLELGYVQRDQFNYEEAAAAFGRVVSILEERKSDDFDWRKQLADALVAQGEVRLMTTGPGTATRDFNRALEVLPDYALAYFSIGEAYKRKYADSKQLGDLQLAEESMLRAREIEPGNPEFAFGLGVLYQQVLSAADSANSDQYMRKAVRHYEDYIATGGGQVETVRGWIRESGGDDSDTSS